MELIGDEKRIRALFSELKWLDEQSAPRFNALWHRAQSRSLRPRRALNLSLAAVTAVLIFALVSLAIWSRFSRPAAPLKVAENKPASSSFSPPSGKQGSETTAPKLKDDHRRSGKRRPVHLGQGQPVIAANKKVAVEAEAIANWQSPTATLLSSTSDDLFNSLPQLNQNANELKSSLPARPNENEKEK